MIIIGITGASGSIYAIRLIEELLKRKKEIAVITSTIGWSTLHFELYNNQNKTFNSIKDILIDRSNRFNPSLLKEYDDSDFYSPYASGSSKTDAVIIVPCSMKTLAAMASGYAANLITRAADVALKENKKLIVIPRETPLHIIHLDNMKTIAAAGAIIVPPMPAFYTLPKTIDDIINATIGKILSLLEIEHDLVPSWQQMITPD